MDARPTSIPDADAAGKIGDLAAGAGIRRVHVLAWRDLADVEAGGSELHIDRIAAQWAAAGVEVVLRSSFAAGHPPTGTRHGYRTVRRAGRYLVFPRAVAAELAGRHGRRDALVEVWNGTPFLTPLWATGPRLVIVHHVHREMWRMALPAGLAVLGDLVERRLAPPLYRRSQIVTPSASSRQELHEQMGLPLERIAVVPNGVDDLFRPAPAPMRAPEPTILAVGRLVPVKRFDLLIHAVRRVRQDVPSARLVIAGEGYERDALQALVDRLDAHEWVELPGYVDDATLLRLYRTAWVVASASLREGWGMSLTEGAAVGTPAVATRIAGHLDAVRDGETGLLVEDGAIAGALVRVLRDAGLRARLGAAAEVRARELTWSATATELMRLLAADARARRR